ncbi:MAG: hypothetical protein V1926_01840 [Candidatus Peregrinibacteria bacterium]
MALTRTIDEHYAIITRVKEETDRNLQKYRELHEGERRIIDEEHSKMNILAFGIVGAVIALNPELSIDNLITVIGMAVLILNALWNFFIQDEQHHINRDFAWKKAEKLHAELSKLLDKYHELVDHQTEEKEKELMTAKNQFTENSNVGSFAMAQQTPWSLGRKLYFVVFAIGLFLIGAGFLFPVSLHTKQTPSSDFRRIEYQNFWRYPNASRDWHRW